MSVIRAKMAAHVMISRIDTVARVNQYTVEPIVKHPFPQVNQIFIYFAGSPNKTKT